MEIRLLIMPSERQKFAASLGRARSRRKVAFGDKAESRHTLIHLTFADLYGVFDDDTSEPDRMIAGFAMHSLAAYGQSYPKPDLTHLPPERVFEVGELWSLGRCDGLATRSSSAILAVRRAVMIISGLQKAGALLIYPIARPWDTTKVYPEFDPGGPLVEWPYGKCTTGERIYVQPMVLAGEKLAALVARAFAAGFEAREGSRLIRFPDDTLAALQALRQDTQTGPVVPIFGWRQRTGVFTGRPRTPAAPVDPANRKPQSTTFH